ncbi:hypothetical protein BFJ65_g18742 [Fusarium oxysporum f. sp. cepae]|uniref:Uncharacterized protein n=1 Tax=Fusarium oxysporum f. sp. cepae TaxID=396571 RepID=A0A3L6MN55_FUSOX|nr:hypothetical protein BFJ65_g18742 [Fusarium oxysporum f. sp. cepae]
MIRGLNAVLAVETKPFGTFDLDTQGLKHSSTSWANVGG